MKRRSLLLVIVTARKRRFDISKLTCRTTASWMIIIPLRRLVPPPLPTGSSLAATRWLRIHNNTPQVTNSEHCSPVNDLLSWGADAMRDETKSSNIPRSLYYKWMFEWIVNMFSLHNCFCWLDPTIRSIISKLLSHRWRIQSFAKCMRI